MQQIILVLAIGSLTFINASVLPIKFNFGNNKPVSFAVKQCGKLVWLLSKDSKEHFFLEQLIYI